MTRDNGALDAYARLIVEVGVNLEAGQTLGISAFVEHAPLVREVVRVAYEQGTETALLLRLDVVDADGTSTRIVTGSDWHSRPSHNTRAGPRGGNTPTPPKPTSKGGTASRSPSTSSIACARSSSTCPMKTSVRCSWVSGTSRTGVADVRSRLAIDAC